MLVVHVAVQAQAQRRGRMTDELFYLHRDDPCNDLAYQRYLDEMEMQDLLAMEEDPDYGNEVEAEHRRLRALPVYKPQCEEETTRGR